MRLHFAASTRKTKITIDSSTMDGQQQLQQPPSSSVMMRIPIKRQLRFQKKIKIYYVKCVDDTSRQELEARWYSSSDYQSYKEEAAAVADSLSDNHGNKKKFSGGGRRDYESLLLGLETRQEKVERRSRVSASRLALLREQQKHWYDDDVFDEEEEENDDETNNCNHNNDKTTTTTPPQQREKSRQEQSELMMAQVYAMASSASKMLALKRGFALAFHVQFNMDNHEAASSGGEGVGKHLSCSPGSSSGSSSSAGSTDRPIGRHSTNYTARGA